jgi:hypothetical protein
MYETKFCLKKQISFHDKKKLYVPSSEQLTPFRSALHIMIYPWLFNTDKNC